MSWRIFLFQVSSQVVLIVGARVDGSMAPPSPKSSYFIEFTPGRSTLNFFSIQQFLEPPNQNQIGIWAKNSKDKLTRTRIKVSKWKIVWFCRLGRSFSERKMAAQVGEKFKISAGNRGVEKMVDIFSKKKLSFGKFR